MNRHDGGSLQYIKISPTATFKPTVKYKFGGWTFPQHDGGFETSADADEGPPAKF